MVDIAAIILAAGRSSRFLAAGGSGRTKLAAPLAGKPLVRHVAEAALATSARPLVVVTGHARAAVEAALAGLDLRFVHNARFASGLASSLKTGLGALDARADGAIVLLGDMPALAPQTVARLIGAFEARPDALAAVPVQGGRRGNPVLLSRALFSAIDRLEGDEGARRLLAGLTEGQILQIPVEGTAADLDVDTPEALAAVGRALERSGKAREI